MAVELPPVPDRNKPFVDQNGQVSQAWYQFLTRLREYLKENVP